MLLELYQYVTTPVPAYVKKMGFLKESIAMDARYRRCRRHWDAHYRLCQKAILEAADQATSHRTAVILGAGTLRDIPLEALSARFEQVVLVDLLFLKSARARSSHFSNVRLVETDVTGLLKPLFDHNVRQPFNDLVWKTPNLSSFVSNAEIDLVVSLNLITQLPLVPINLRLKQEKPESKHLDAMARQLMNDHLHLLNQCQGVRCLIADREVNEYDRSMVRTDGFDPTWEVVLPKPSQTWEWILAPFGEMHQNLCQIHRVGVSIW